VDIQHKYCQLATSKAQSQSTGQARKIDRHDRVNLQWTGCGSESVPYQDLFLL